MSDEQRLNTLGRFRKDPGRLVLEEHSHCEVPAGCGGVVLRWRTRAVLPVVFHCYLSGQGNWLLDGEELSTARVDLVSGRHVIACAISSVDRSSGLILFAATHWTAAPAGSPGSDPSQPSFKLVSAGDGSWKYTLDEPPAGWSLPSFDDARWPALAEVGAPSFTANEPGAYQGTHCLRLGAVCLGLPNGWQAPRSRSRWKRLLGRGDAGPVPTLGPIWIRKTFEVPKDRSAGPST
jgi:hypothetical protein